MAYLMPVSGYTGSASWRAHINRGTPSQEPGTDLYVPIGTPLYAPESGTIWGYGTSIAPATGRWIGINFDDGRSFRALHLSKLVRTSGRVNRGELIGYTGATGYGEEDWSWNVAETGGAHVHVTLWPTWDHIYGYKSPGNPYTIDFMQYTSGETAGGSSTEFGDFLMALSDTQQRQIYEALVVGGPSAGAYYTPQAIVNILRGEISKQVAEIRDALRAKNSDGTAYLGYDMLPAIINQNNGLSEQIKNIKITLNAEAINQLAKSVSEEVIKALPDGTNAPSAEEIAVAVRAKFKAEPLS